MRGAQERTARGGWLCDDDVREREGNDPKITGHGLVREIIESV